jgi:hypothetical protein
MQASLVYMMPKAQLVLWGPLYFFEILDWQHYHGVVLVVWVPHAEWLASLDILSRYVPELVTEKAGRK